MSAASDTDVVLRGHGRLLPAGADGDAELTLRADGFSLRIGGITRVAGYRDLETIAVQGGTALIVLGVGPASERALLDRFGEQQGALTRQLRDRRLLQRLRDGFVDHVDSAVELVQTDSGVAQIAYHPWGGVVAPLDERQPWVWLRRGRIDSATVDSATGRVAVSIAEGRGQLELLGLGDRARLQADRLSALRQGALDDAGRLVGRLMPDAGYGERARAASLLVDGRPAAADELGAAWAPLERGVLGEEPFASSYRTLVERGGPHSGRWIALAPMSPGSEEARIWFFVELPGDLIAMELVSEGAHATYLFRANGNASAAICEISEALIDARYLREPIALPEDQLGTPEHLPYRMALRALPSLAAARARFVTRLIHTDADSWAAALDAAIKEA